MLIRYRFSWAVASMLVAFLVAVMSLVGWWLGAGFGEVLGDRLYKPQYPLPCHPQALIPDKHYDAIVICRPDLEDDKSFAIFGVKDDRDELLVGVYKGKSIKGTVQEILEWQEKLRLLEEAIRTTPKQRLARPVA